MKINMQFKLRKKPFRRFESYIINKYYLKIINNINNNLQLEN